MEGLTALMSFSGNLRAETARMIPSGRGDKDTSIAALMANICRLSADKDGVIRMHFSAGNLPALRKCFTLIQKTVNIRPDLPTPWLISDDRQPDRRTAGPVTSGNDEKAVPSDIDLDASSQMRDLLERLHILNRDGTLRPQDGTLEEGLVGGRRDRAYLREMFLCTGFMNDPAKRYHLEYRCFSEPQSEQLRGVLARHGIHAGMTTRKRYFVVYLKDSEDIVTLLHLMEASVSLMATENARILKEVRNSVNRRVNCETANIGKTVESAGRQLEDIRFLEECGVLETLPASLREAAALRTGHPGASLSELGTLAIPPVGRSGMNHRLRKLSATAQKVREEKKQT